MAKRHKIIRLIPENFERSIDLNGTDECYMGLDLDVLGTGDNWSVSCWFKADAIDGEIMWMMDSGAGEDDCFMLIEATDALRVIMFDDQPLLFKDYTWDSTISTGTWFHVVVTWDGDDDLKLYLDKVEKATTSRFRDLTGTMGDQTRAISYGCNIAAAQVPDPGSLFDGKLGPLAIWNVTLDSANITKIFDDKFAIDLKQDSGAYTQSAALIHYYRMSQKRVGFLDRAGSKDLTDTLNLSLADISTDVPT